MTTKARPRARTPRWPAVSASLVLHAALLAGASAIPGGAIADVRAPAGPDVPARLTWTPRPEACEAVVAAAPVADTARIPAPPAERVVAADDETEAAAIVAEPAAPESLDDPPRAPDPSAAPPAPTFALSRRLHDSVSRNPGCGEAGAGSEDGAGGAIGVGGAGGPGGGTGLGDGSGVAGTASFGAGHGAGSDGTGSGWTGRAPGGGATCGPSIVGELPAPDYPAKARARGWEGRVVLLLDIDAHGRVVSASVAESSGRTALDDAARDAARGWTFAPALREGAAVAGTLRVPVRFELTD